MPFYLFAWIAETCYALGTIAGKLSSRYQIANPWLFNFIWVFLTVLFTLPFGLAAGMKWPTHWGPLLFLGVFSTLSGTLYILSLYALDVSILSPIYNLRTTFTVILGILLFHERLIGYQIALIIIMIIAGLFVTADEKLGIRSFLQKSILLGFVTIISSSIYAVSVKNAMQYEGFWEVTLWGNVLTLILLLVTVPLFWKDVKKLRTHHVSGVFWSSLLLTFGLFAANRAYAVNIGISSAIMSLPLSMILAFLFSIFAPKLLEKHTMKVYAIRFSAAAVMFIAALQLSK